MLLMSNTYAFAVVAPERHLIFDCSPAAFCQQLVSFVAARLSIMHISTRFNRSTLLLPCKQITGTNYTLHGSETNCYISLSKCDEYVTLVNNRLLFVSVLIMPFELMINQSFPNRLLLNVELEGWNTNWPTKQTGYQLPRRDFY